MRRHSSQRGSVCSTSRAMQTELEYAVFASTKEASLRIDGRKDSLRRG